MPRFSCVEDDIAAKTVRFRHDEQLEQGLAEAVVIAEEEFSRNTCVSMEDISAMLDADTEPEAHISEIVMAIKAFFTKEQNTTIEYDEISCVLYKA